MTPSATDRRPATRPRLPLRRAFVALFLLAVAGSAGGSMSDPVGFGSRLRALGDIDGDGVADFAIGSLARTGKYRLRAVSGKKGTLLWIQDGNDVAGVSDQDGDGLRDVVIARYAQFAPPGQGPFWAEICSGTTAKVISRIPGAKHGEFTIGAAAAIEALGDVDGDDKEDFLFTHLGWSGSQDEWCTGADVAVRSIEGKLIGQIEEKTWLPLRPSVDPKWRAFVAGPAGDLDGDGKMDVAVACFRERGLFPFEVVTVKNAAIARWKSDRSWRTSAIVPFADADGDGTTDLLVGETSRGDAQGRDFTGEVRVVSGKTGKTIKVVKGEHSGDYLGTSVTATADLDGDGFPDFVAGAPGADRSRKDTSVGCVRAYSGKTGKPVWSFKGDKDRIGLGAAVCAIGDMDADGVDDVAAGSEELLPHFKGYVVVISGKTGKETRRFEE